jgi:hypothetical protein
MEDLMVHTSRTNQTAVTNRRPYSQQTTAKKLYGPDKMGIVIFHDSARTIVNPTALFDVALQEQIQKLPCQVSGSGTNLTAGLRAATRMAAQAPAGCLKRIWCLTDGEPTREEDSLMDAVVEARNHRININTIGFGDPGQYDAALLQRIAGATHNGRFVPVDSLRTLSDALTRNGGHNRHQHRQEVTVMAIDCSPSMGSAMEGKKRIEVVVDAHIALLRYKQQVFA